MRKKKQQPKREIYLERKKCNCIAQKHELINNCLSCGKVVCALEGEGPCLYCGQLVTRPDGKFITNDEALFPTLNKQQLAEISMQRSKATLYKDNLVERDKSTSMTQNIYDETVDYYDISENQWIDESSREAAINRIMDKDKYIQTEQFKNKIVFDPLTKQFVRQQFSFDEDQFRKEGGDYLQAQEEKEYQQKIQNAKKKYDNRMMEDNKVKQIVTELKKKESNNSKKDKPAKEVKSRVVQVLIQEETNEQEKVESQANQ